MINQLVSMCGKSVSLRIDVPYMGYLFFRGHLRYYEELNSKRYFIVDSIPVGGRIESAVFEPKDVTNISEGYIELRRKHES